MGTNEYVPGTSAEGSSRVEEIVGIEAMSELFESLKHQSNRVGETRNQVTTRTEGRR